jgi:hypothetical protein
MRAARSIQLKSSELAEPTEREFQFGSFELMGAHEMFEADVLESGAPHIRRHLTF